MHIVRYFVLVVLIAGVGCGASDDRDTGSVDAGGQDARSTDTGAMDAGVADAGESLDSGEPVDSGDTQEAGVQIVEADIVARPKCDVVCSDLSKVCDESYSWFLGSFNGGGFADYGPNFEVGVALECAVEPAAVDSEGGRQYALTRFRCACR